MEKRKFIDFEKQELIPGTLTGMFFHYKIEKILKESNNAVLLVESEENNSEEKRLSVYVKNQFGYFSCSISTNDINNNDINNKEMNFWFEAYK